MQAPYSRTRIILVIFLIVALIGLQFTLSPPRVAAAGGTLTVEIIAAPNLVVDSNALATSTYAPKVATVIGKFCNTDSTASVDNVTAYIGDFSAGTPGTYPSKTDPTVGGLTYSGTYAFEHLGGTADGTRFLGTLAAGECRYQYWSFEYPHYAINADGGAKIATWGTSVKPDDDLSLNFDVWASGDDGATTDNVSHTMTMRNEISAMANKIKPNGNPAGQWFNTDTSVVYPGDTITTNGVLYRLGNINQGFDNDDDGVPDYNAWLQPFGDPAYDPSCFRLIGTTGVLTVTRSAGNPDLIIPIDNNLYFTDIPSDNTDVRGLVYYEFLALGGACTVPISPYQEVASGSDNEKFNGDYGTGVPAIKSYEPAVSLAKSAPGSQTEGTTFTYEISFENASSTTPAGLTLSSGGVNAGLMISDTVPVGLEYVAGSATANNTIPSGNSLSIRYSKDSGQTWSVTDPGSTLSTDTNRVVIQWWLNEPLDVSGSGSSAGTVRYQATIPSTYIVSGGDPFIENCATASFGDGMPFDESCATTLVEGNGEIGNRVWIDENGDGIQDTGESTNINGVTISLYWDKNGNRTLDSGDVLVSTRDSGSTTDADETNTNYNFTNLPDGDYLITVDKADSDIDTVAEGYTLTTPEVFLVTLSATNRNYNDADFGFGPTLMVVKSLRSKDIAYVEDEDVVFTIDLVNTLPGDGTANGFCQYTVWATSAASTGNANSQWASPLSATGYPDGQYAYTDLSDASDVMDFSGFDIGEAGGNITKVEYIVHAREKDLLTNIEKLSVRVFYSGSQIGTDYDYNGLTHFNQTIGELYAFRQDVTALRSWVWSDFSSSTTGLQLEGTKSAAGQGNIEVDAVAYIITTDQLCGGADTTIATLPVEDTYDASLLEFLSADPPVSQVDVLGTVGTLTWDNVGPVYAGGTQRITVTFKALGTTASTTNNAAVTEAEFATGRNVNDDNDNATVSIEASGSIAGTVWADSGTTPGWIVPTPSSGYDPGDSIIPNVTVELYGCFDLYSNMLISPSTVKSVSKPCTDSGNEGEWRRITTQITDSSGNYLFDALHDGYYDVRVDTTTLPNNFTQTTAEPALAANGDGFTCGTCDNQWSANEALNQLNYLDNSTGGEDITDVSFGYENATDLGAVMGYVWHDADGDGVWDIDENAIPNVTVTLNCSGGSCTASSLTTTTDENGFYAFSDLATGVDANYDVVITQPAGMSQTGDPDESGVTCSASCDNTTSSAFTLSANEVKGPYNFGYDGGLTIGDTVYVDWNGNGSQDTPTEEGIGGVTLRLYGDINGNGVIDNSDSLLGVTETLYNVIDGYLDIDNDGLIADGDDDATRLLDTDVIDGKLDINGDGTIGSEDDGTFAGYSVIDGLIDINGGGVSTDDDAALLGTYEFTDVPSNNNYIVTVDTGTLPAAMVQTGDPDESGTCTSCDSRDPLHLAGVDYLAADFGYQPRGFGVIGDTVWADDNANGVIDTNETGIPGVTINLYQDQNGDGIIDTDDTLIDTRTTLGYDVIAGSIDTNGDGVIDTSDDQTDAHDVDIIDGSLDINGNGIIDTNDDGTFVGYAIVDGKIDLDGNGTVSTIDNGALDGRYQFINLAAGQYIVAISTADFNYGQPLYSLVQTYDQDSTTVLDNQDVITLGDAEIYTSGDFGYTSSAIGDFIWQDNDGDGIWDSNEPGINGVIVELYVDADNDGIADSGTADATATTANNSEGQPGYYLFGGLSANNYIVKVADSNFTTGVLVDYDLTGDPNSYNDTTPTSLSCLAVGAQACDGINQLRGVTIDTTFFPGLQLGQNDLSSDFGYQPKGGVIGDTVWIDTDADDVRDADERGIAYVTVQLCTDATCTTVLQTTETDENGTYSFSGLSDGTNYYIRVDTSDSDFPAGLTATYDRDGAADSQINTVVLTAGHISSVNGTSCVDCDWEMDFGYRFEGTNTINGTVWHDTDSGGQLNGIGDIDTEETVRYEDVPVYLWRCVNGCGGGDDILVGLTTTDSTGQYSFTELAAGDYIVSANGNAYSIRGTEATTTLLYNDALPQNPAVSFVGSGETAIRDFGFVSTMDFGDLPVSYEKTLIAVDGARHTLPSSGAVSLGATVDVDADGQEDTYAAGDDSDGNNDDDGVTTDTGTWVDGSDGGSINVTTSGCTTSCYVNAWIDWNADGDFLDADEQILQDAAVTDGASPQTLTFDIPEGTMVGSKTFYTRVRLYKDSTDGWARPTGLIINGEVEDYRWTFGPTAVTLTRVSGTAKWSAGVTVLVLSLLSLAYVTLAQSKQARITARAD